jgi:hypothetical protein
MANKAGWYPLCIFWGIRSVAHLDQYSDVDNILIIRGFSEGVLTQILGAIRRGSVSQEDQLWAVNSLPELSPVAYKKLYETVS